MQLVAYGAQDIYLTGNPQITFFKVVYRRHTNFSMEAIEQTMLGTTGSGTSQTSTISRNGDLIHRTYLEVEWNTLFTATPQSDPGAYMLDTVELEIGGKETRISPSPLPDLHLPVYLRDNCFYKMNSQECHFPTSI